MGLWERLVHDLDGVQASSGVYGTSSFRTEKVVFRPGLTTVEMRAAEVRFGIRFPPDLASFLTIALPFGRGFPNWRSLDDEDLMGRLNAPIEGFLFDVGHNGYWHDDWPSRPDSMDASLQLARTILAVAPKLIPIYSHRYMCEEPAASGNPVVSVWQTDIVYYGINLESYFRHEFLGQVPDWSAGVVTPPFWPLS